MLISNGAVGNVVDLVLKMPTLVECSMHKQLLAKYVALSGVKSFTIDNLLSLPVFACIVNALKFLSAVTKNGLIKTYFLLTNKVADLAECGTKCLEMLEVVEYYLQLNPQ